MRAAAVAIFLTASIASPALAADQFDLICRAKKEAYRYRIDLARGEFCADECKVVQKIASVTAGDITLSDEKPVTRNAAERFEKISRASGDWYSYSFSPRFENLPTVLKGKCEPAPFSGFPAAKF